MESLYATYKQKRAITEKVLRAIALFRCIQYNNACLHIPTFPLRTLAPKLTQRSTLHCGSVTRTDGKIKLKILVTCKIFNLPFSAASQ